MQKAGGGNPTYAQQLRALTPTTKDKSRQKGKEKEGEKKKNPLEPIQNSIPVDERTIVFEQSPDAPQLDWLAINQIASHVNNALSMVPPQVQTEKF